MCGGAAPHKKSQLQCVTLDGHTVLITKDEMLPESVRLSSAGDSQWLIRRTSHWSALWLLIKAGQHNAGSKTEHFNFSPSRKYWQVRHLLYMVQAPLPDKFWSEVLCLIFTILDTPLTNTFYFKCTSMALRRGSLLFSMEDTVGLSLTARDVYSQAPKWS